MTNDPRYPIGPFSSPAALGHEEREAAMSAIEVAPKRLREAVSGLNASQLNTPYRQGGWTVRQLVHHVADSHINAFVRLKLTLTENVPTIRTYDQARWAELADASAPIGVSLDLLDRIHERWMVVWRSMTSDDWARQLHHPEAGRMGVDQLLALYAWHGKHHVAHVTSLREAEGW